MLQNEYYVVERENNDNYPLFSWDQKSAGTGKGVPIQYSEPLKFCLGEPIPPSFEWVDFHEAPQPLISFPLARILEKLEIYGIQLIPAKVSNHKDPFSDPQDYCFVHVLNTIPCLDKGQSIITTNKAGDLIWGIEKFALDDKALGLIELRKRLIFELAEKTSILLMHQSIKEAIESISPKGIRFIPVAQWNTSSAFN